MNRTCQRCGQAIPNGGFVCTNCNTQDIQYKRVKEHDYLASASLFLGIMGLVMVLFPVVGFAFGGVGLYLGIIRRNKQKGVPGIVMNTLTLILSVIYWGSIFLGYI